MKRAAATIAVLLLGLAGTLARADWRAVTGLTGAPKDLWIQDAGTFSVLTTASAYEMRDDGASFTNTANFATTSSVCAAIVSGCERSVSTSNSQDECRGTTPVSGGILGLDGCRATERFSGYGAGLDSMGVSKLFYSGSGAFGDAWTVIPGVTAATDPVSMSARTIGGVDYALFNRGPVQGWLFVSNNLPMSAPTFTAPLSQAWGTDLYGGRDGGLHALVGGRDGGVRFTYQASGVLKDFIDLGPTSPYDIKGFSLSELDGDQNGAGHGLAVVQSPVLPPVYSAIPNPADPGRYWVPNSALGTLPAPPAGNLYDMVRCDGAKYCVLASSTTTTGTRVVVYRNLAAPTVQQPNFTVAEGATLTIGVDAGDPDGDAVYVTWVPEPGASNYLSLAEASVDGRSQVVTVVDGNTSLCQVDHYDVHVDVQASDGLASHLGTDGGAIRVVHNRPVAPGGGPFLTPAGSPQLGFDLPFDTPCGSLSGAQLDPLSIQAGPALGTATLVPANKNIHLLYLPPRVYCSPTPGTNQHALRIIEGPLVSDAGIVTFTVTPWGEPEPPFAAGRTVFQDAGSVANYAPEATHLCGDAGSAFPGTDTTWTWSASGFGPLQPIILRSDGSALLASGGVTPFVTVSAPDCESGTIDFLAYNTTRDGGMTGQDAGLRVDVATVLRPLSAGLVQLTAREDAGIVEGDISFNGSLNCPQLRGGAADVALVRESDGGIVSSAMGVSAPGSFTLPTPGACGGGQFHVTASVQDSTGMVGPLVSPTFSLPLAAPGFAQVSVSDFTISCGDAGHATATATFGSGQCQSSVVTWSGSGAVPLSPATGTTVELTTASTDFGGLIGMPVDVVATATAETGSATMSPAQRPVVRADPLFVSATHRTDTAVASESRILGVEVTLTNTTACDVSGVVWHESLSGMQWVGGPVQTADGGAVDAGMDGGELVVTGLSLPAGQSVTFRYSARPALLGNPSPGGVATLRDVPISNPSGFTGGGSTCGCQSAAGAWPALLALVAAAMLRRKIRSRS